MKLITVGFYDVNLDNVCYTVPMDKNQEGQVRLKVYFSGCPALVLKGDEVEKYYMATEGMIS